jgi:hypothetical protein
MGFYYTVDLLPILILLGLFAWIIIPFSIPNQKGQTEQIPMATRVVLCFPWIVLYVIFYLLQWAFIIAGDVLKHLETIPAKVMSRLEADVHDTTDN